MAHQRQPPSPRSCWDISPRPSITIGKAVPSLSPPSPVSPKRKRSRSCGSETCTSDASTGSVGARMAPSNTATPSGRSMSHTPAAARAPTVISMDTVASCTGMRQRPSRHGSSSLSPTVKSEMSTAISVRRSKSEASSIGSSTSRPNPQGPMPTPTAKYRIAELSGTRAMNELVNVMTTSSRPTRAKAIAGISSSDMEAQGRTRRRSAHCGVHAFPRMPVSCVRCCQQAPPLQHAWGRATKESRATLTRPPAGLVTNVDILTGKRTAGALTVGAP
jgi:hypothetical protein